MKKLLFWVIFDQLSPKKGRFIAFFASKSYLKTAFLVL